MQPGRHLLAGVLVTAAVTLALGALPGSGAEAAEVTERLKLTADLGVRWNIRDLNGNVSKGHLSIKIKGVLEINEQFSSLRYGMPAVMVPYSAKSMTARYTYQETQDLADPPHCANPDAVFKGEGEFQPPAVPGPGNLNIHTLGSIAESFGLTEIASGAGMDAMVDRYDLFIPFGKIQEVPGKRSSQAKPCVMHETSKGALSGGITIRATMNRDGTMSGSKTWTARFEGGSPSDTVAVSTLPGIYMEKRFTPPQGQPGNATYTLSWNIEALSSPRIMMKRDDCPKNKPYCVDITSGPETEPTKVVVGQLIDLKGVLFPLAKDPGRGKWTIDDNNTSSGRFIKDFRPTLDEGKVERLNPGNDLAGQAVSFYWKDEGTAVVKYEVKVDKGNLTGEAEFSVKKPAFKFMSLARSSNTFGPLELGEPLDPNDCCGPRATKEEEAHSKKCKALKAQLAGLDPNDRFNRPPFEDYRDLCLIQGLQYKGITLTATPEDDTPGEVEFIQLITRTKTWVESDGDGDIKMKSDKEALDGCFPYPKNVSAYATRDLPGFSVPGGNGYDERDLRFKIYLMFKHDSPDSILAPLKVIDWHWKGAIRCTDGKCEEFTQNEIIPASSAGRDVSEYPEWETCSH